MLGAKPSMVLTLSPAMLTVANQTAAYRNLAQADLTRRIEKSRRKRMTCVGTFPPGHVGPDPCSGYQEKKASSLQRSLDIRRCSKPKLKD